MMNQKDTQDNSEIKKELELSRPVVYFNWFLRSFPQFIAKQRFLAYTSEVGESFRPIIPKFIVNASYGASIFYVGADVYIHTNEMINNNKPKKEIILKTSDRIVWHSFASMILPAFFIHSIVKYSNKGINKINFMNKYPRGKSLMPTFIGLISIPFIIHPIDHLTDWSMDNSVRKFYDKF